MTETNRIERSEKELLAELKHFHSELYVMLDGILDLCEQEKPLDGYDVKIQIAGRSIVIPNNAELHEGIATLVRNEIKYMVAVSDDE